MLFIISGEANIYISEDDDAYLIYTINNENNFIIGD